MIRRDFLWSGAAALAALAGTRRAAHEAAATRCAAETFEVTKTEAEWRAILTTRAVRGAAPGRHRISRHQPAAPREAQGQFPLRRLRPAALFVARPSSNSGTGWPSFWEALPDAVGTEVDTFAVHDPHRSPLPPLRRPSRPRLRRRPAADRQAPLHQRRGADLQAGGRLTIPTAAKNSGLAARSFCMVGASGPGQEEHRRKPAAHV